MTKEQFYVGQRIKQKVDEGHGPQWFYGHVKEIGDDYVLIQWPDIMDPVKHMSHEWPDIKLGNPGVE